MNKSNILSKITKIEADLKALKRSIGKKTDLERDQKTWLSVERVLRNVRKRTFQKYYGKG